MKALTLTQPWAFAVQVGAKRFETRSWDTKHRGPLAIHAAKGFAGIGGKQGFLEVCASEPFRTLLAMHGLTPADLPLGAIGATCDLAQTATTSAVLDYLRSPGRLMGDEIKLGDYSDGRFAYEIVNVREVGPYVCTGALGLWSVPTEIEALLAAVPS